jgi:HEAT repeat protein
MAADNSTLKLVKSPNIVADRNASALADVYKALKAVSFYPEGHPQRGKSLRLAHESLQQLLNGRDLSFAVSRTGFAAAGGGAPVGGNTKAQNLAKELFIRRVQQLTLLKDTSRDDLQAFLGLLTFDPRKIQDAGGMETLMQRCSITSIWVNEVDMDAIHEKRKKMEEEGAATQMPDEEILFALESLPSVELPPQQEYSFDELLVLLYMEKSDGRYLQLAKQVVNEAEKLMEAGEFRRVIPAIELLERQIADPDRSDMQREYASFTFEQLAGGAMSDFLLDQLQDKEHADNEWIYRILQQLGAKVVYAIIQRICLAEGLFARKALALALIRIGAPAVPPLVVMLKDERWYVVRNMIAMLGEIGSREWVSEMRGAAAHPDPRVRKEAIRSLAKIGGGEAEQIIIRLLNDPDQGIVRQAIISLGTMKCRSALPQLLQIIETRDRFLKTLAIKKDAVQAIGIIGDRQVAPHLLAILVSSHILAWSRWQELKTSVAQALGQLGAESALPELRNEVRRGGKLGAACSDAIDAIERLSEGAS